LSAKSNLNYRDLASVASSSKYLRKENPMKKKFMQYILFLMCGFTAIAYGIESDQASCEITIPEACDQHPDCPQENHPTGTNCPHQDPSPY
jgi:hypothetical protein